MHASHYSDITYCYFDLDSVDSSWCNYYIGIFYNNDEKSVIIVIFNNFYITITWLPI